MNDKSGGSAPRAPQKWRRGGLEKVAQQHQQDEDGCVVVPLLLLLIVVTRHHHQRRRHHRQVSPMAWEKEVKEVMDAPMGSPEKVLAMKQLTRGFEDEIERAYNLIDENEDPRDKSKESAYLSASVDEDTIDTKEKELHSLKRKINLTNAKLNFRDSEHEKLKVELEDVRRYWEESIRKYKGQLADLKDQLRREQKQKSSLSSDLHNSIRELNFHKAEQEKLKVQLAADARDREKMIEKYEEQVSELRDHLLSKRNSNSVDAFKFQRSVEEKDEEISLLQSRLKESQVKCETLNKELIEERGPRLDETRRLQVALNAKQEKMDLLKAKLEDETKRSLDETAALMNVQEKISSMNVMMERYQIERERAHVERERTSAEMTALREEIEAARSTVDEKSEEATAQTVMSERLRGELETVNKTLMEERGSRQDETRQSRAMLDSTKKEVALLEGQLQDEALALKKAQEKISSMNVIIEANHAESEKASSEIADLREKIDAASGFIAEKSDEVSALSSALEEQNKTLKDMDSKVSALNDECGEKQSEISSLQSDRKEQGQLVEEMQVKIRDLEQELKSSKSEIQHLLEDIVMGEDESLFNHKLSAISEERDLLIKEAKSKSDEITELTSENEHILQEMEGLKQWRKVAEKEKMASGVLMQKVVDLESDLEHQKTKHREAVMALHELENALMVVEIQRQKQAQKNHSPGELAIDINPSGESRSLGKECCDTYSF